MLMGVGSCLPNDYNRVQILRLNENVGITKELEINEPYPSTKIMWAPRNTSIDENTDLLASSSDILRIYQLRKEPSEQKY